MQSFEELNWWRRIEADEEKMILRWFSDKEEQVSVQRAIYTLTHQAFSARIGELLQFFNLDVKDEILPLDKLIECSSLLQCKSTVENILECKSTDKMVNSMSSLLEKTKIIKKAYMQQALNTFKRLGLAEQASVFQTMLLLQIENENGTSSSYTMEVLASGTKFFDWWQSCWFFEDAPYYTDDKAHLLRLLHRYNESEARQKNTVHHQYCLIQCKRKVLTFLYCALNMDSIDVKLFERPEKYLSAQAIKALLQTRRILITNDLASILAHCKVPRTHLEECTKKIKAHRRDIKDQLYSIMKAMKKLRAQFVSEITSVEVEPMPIGEFMSVPIESQVFDNRKDEMSFKRDYEEVIIMVKSGLKHIFRGP